MSRLYLIALLPLLMACSGNNDSASEDPKSIQTGIMSYTEPWRPQFHFSPNHGWMNDPNGMVFHNGEYHLFYQHYPDSTVWGPMHWGHAVSSDMVHWEHLPIALYPDSLGYIFSGSAVVDKENTTGFGTKEKPALVAMFTYHDPKGEQAGRNDFQTQGIAYSNDNGRTWTKYKGNPVLRNPGIRDFRDPKVSWWPEKKQWLLTLAVKDHVEFFSSPDLKQWTKLSEFGKEIGNHGGVWECPDFFPLTDEHGSQRWVLLSSINPGGPQGGSATQYFIGSFDGKKFTPQDNVTRWIDHGADNYAGVTWSDIIQADGRRLFLGWMSNWQYANIVPTGVWRSAMTLPREIQLILRNNTYELRFQPVAELDGVLGREEEATDSASLPSGGFRLRFNAKGSEGFELSFSNGMSERLGISFAEGKLTVDRRKSGRTSFSDGFAAAHAVDLSGIDMENVELWMDAASVEIFINSGERVMTELVFPTVPYDMVRLEKQDARFTFQPVSRIWNDEPK